MHGLSVNFHLWKPCNFKCRYCFATFEDVKQRRLPQLYLSETDSCSLIHALAEHGFLKITFAGGEPTLCPWIEQLFICAKKCGMATMLVTNGYRIDDAFLERNKTHLDWIALSVDSLSPLTNFQIGRRTQNAAPFDGNVYLSLAQQIKSYGYRLKINTVVSTANKTELMSDFINAALPERWKVLQVLPVKGQNDKEIGKFLISEDQFSAFLELNSSIKSEITFVPESCNAIQGSYMMIDPIGRFFDDTTGEHTYSREILKVGVERALSEIRFDLGKFHDRKGLFDW